VPGSDEDVTRLIAVVERQRRELDRIRAAAADQSVIAMARGVLMERLGLSSAEAAGQLAGLSAATGMSLGEMAAAVLSQDESAGSSLAVDGQSPRDGGPSQGAGLGRPDSPRVGADMPWRCRRIPLQEKPPRECRNRSCSGSYSSSLRRVRRSFGILAIRL